jgi:hypothetical protein
MVTELKENYNNNEYVEGFPLTGEEVKQAKNKTFETGSSNY